MDLLNTYHTILLEKGIQGYSMDQCLNDYRLSIVINLMRVVINLGVGRDSFYLDVVLPRYNAAVVDLNADKLLPG